MLWTAGSVDSYPAVGACICLDTIWGWAEAKNQNSERKAQKKNVCKGSLPGVICFQQCLVLLLGNSEKEIKRRECRMICVSEFRVSTRHCATAAAYYEGSLLCESGYAIPGPWIHSFIHLTSEQIFVECLDWLIHQFSQATGSSPSHYMQNLLLLFSH